MSMQSTILPISSQEQWVGTQRAAQILGISRQTLYRWEADGKINPSKRTKGGHRRFLLRDLKVIKLGMQPTKTTSEAPQIKIEATNLPIKQLQVVKSQTKVLEVLLLNNSKNPRVLLVLLGWLINLILKIINTINGLQTLAQPANQLQMIYLQTMSQLDLQIQTLELDCDPTISRIKADRNSSQIKISPWEQARRAASSLFTKLTRASVDQQLDEPERQRAHDLVTKILTPYRKLTSYLANHQPGTLKHDLAKLLLCKTPADFGISRANWSIRCLAKVCRTKLQTKSASKSQVGRVLKELNWYTALKRKLHSPDPQYGIKLRQIANTINRLKPDDLLVFGDEFKYTSAKIAEVLRLKHAPEGLEEVFFSERIIQNLTSYVPIVSLHLSGLYDPCSKRFELEPLVKSDFSGYFDVLTKMVDRLLEDVPGTLYLVLDNASNHRPSFLPTFLDERYCGRVKVLFLPTYSPNNNPIERVWKSLLSSSTRECDTKAELQASLDTAVKEFKATALNQAELRLTCQICKYKWKFIDTKREKNSSSIAKHLCFNMPNFNPYALHVLIHSQEDMMLGQ